MNADITTHPCYNDKAKGKYGRVHLPVAPKCNIQCGYCNRSYDCVNESRPGVTSSVLTPKQAVKYVEEIRKRMPNLKVAGIAGPGDPFANPKETIETLQLIKASFDDMVLCVSTNGLNVAPYIDKLVEIGLTHLTITINAVDPQIGKSVYKWVNDGTTLKGEEGAKLLMDKQLEAVKLAKEAGLIVKVNSIIIPGVNDEHIPEVARTVGLLGADLFNCIKLMPVEGTDFANAKTPDCQMVESVRAEAGKYVEQMRHCARCRSDAVGLLGEKNSKATMELIQSLAKQEELPRYVGVATMEGLFVNMHLGQVEQIAIYEKHADGIKFVENRSTPPSGCGKERWAEFAELFSDCRAILASQAGPKPTETLKAKGIEVICMEGLIDLALNDVYAGKEIRHSVRSKSACCSGTGGGCGA